MTVFFAGSFNPFTVGHASIVERALQQFDRVIIGVGININKEGGAQEADARKQHIEELYDDVPAVSVVTYSGLTAIAAAENGASAILRGVRSVHDFEYEREMADVNRRINGMETVLLFALPELACVSSSVVRELRAFGLDTSDYEP